MKEFIHKQFLRPVMLHEVGSHLLFAGCSGGLVCGIERYHAAALLIAGCCAAAELDSVSCVVPSSSLSTISCTARLPHFTFCPQVWEVADRAHKAMEHRAAGAERCGQGAKGSA